MSLTLTVCRRFSFRKIWKTGKPEQARGKWGRLSSILNKKRERKRTTWREGGTGGVVEQDLRKEGGINGIFKS